MKRIAVIFAMLGFNLSVSVFAWDKPAVVTNILQHRDWVAVYLSPDPGKGSCDHGSPYLIKTDGSAASEQLFSMVLVSLTTGKKIDGYHGDPCNSAIWGVSRPTIERLHLKVN